jgi:GDSL-like Lipase/Acylhydrolase family
LKSHPQALWLAAASQEITMPHVALIGDSIFDNDAYVDGGPDVVRQLRAVLPPGSEATLLAVDGDITAGVADQLRRLPGGATHVVVSVGGNDALGSLPVLQEPARSIANAVLRLAEIGDRFRRDYQVMLDEVLRRRLPTALCTIYEPRFPDPELQRVAVTALPLFNDVITRVAFGHGLPLLDLRLICNKDADYANPIEPSEHGGAKIAAAIAGLLARHDFASGRTQVFVR